MIELLGAMVVVGGGRVEIVWGCFVRLLSGGTEMESDDLKNNSCS